MTATSAATGDPDLTRVTSEEEHVLGRVLTNLERAVAAAQSPQEARVTSDYDRELVDLRNQISEARLEDVPPLIQEMERLQQVASRRSEVVQNSADLSSPYFGRLVLKEGGKLREVLIGRATHLDRAGGPSIVDWRDAPVSRLFYCYGEGDEYEETFGGRDVEGEVEVRRSLAIVEGRLRRIVAPQGTFVNRDSTGWSRASVSGTRLVGGAGAADRPTNYRPPGKLGVGDPGDGRPDRFLPEIAALIDPRQFELMTKPTSGLIVIQGGAGSGKTTIGLHRLAYLSFAQRQRFLPSKMLVIVFNTALARYISRVLPALGVEGVAVLTYQKWCEDVRVAHFPKLPDAYSTETPSEVVRVKKHPLMLKAVEIYLGRREATMENDFTRIVSEAAPEIRDELTRFIAQTKGRPLAVRAHALRERVTTLPAASQATAHAIERLLVRVQMNSDQLAAAYAEIVTDKALLAEAFGDELVQEDLDRFVRWCVDHTVRATADPHDGRTDESAARAAELDDEDPREDDDDDRSVGIDGRHEDTVQPALLDREDDALLLRLWQRARGPLRQRGSRLQMQQSNQPRGSGNSGVDPEIDRANDAEEEQYALPSAKSSRGKQKPEKAAFLRYEHVFVDEAQDLSPIELAVLAHCLTPERSMTLAGDTAQRLFMDNGFTDWATVLEQAGIVLSREAAIEVEPLRLSYRSTEEILGFARSVLGHLAPAEIPKAARTGGVPVELFRFAQSGDAVGFLGEALRELVRAEPLASVALIARFPEQAEMYYRGLQRAEVPNLRRVANQDFVFKSGVDVTDVRQVKGLEFDYVILLDVTSASYPLDDEARHLLHIAATRAAHQLWVICPGIPSALIPESLRERGY